MNHLRRIGRKLFEGRQGRRLGCGATALIFSGPRRRFCKSIEERSSPDSAALAFGSNLGWAMHRAFLIFGRHFFVVCGTSTETCRVVRRTLAESAKGQGRWPMRIIAKVLERDDIRRGQRCDRQINWHVK